MQRLGLVVHPARNVDGALAALREWAAGHGFETLQVPVRGEQRDVAEECDPATCDLVVAVGGDGTMLAAMHEAAAVDRAVLGVACGSLGVLTSVGAHEIASALERWAGGDWGPRRLPALQANSDGGPRFHAFNDIVIARHGQGQVRATARADGVLFNRFAGDGCVVSTPVGSSGYTIAAGGPLLASDLEGFVLTPLNVHGGFRAPLVLSARSVLDLDVTPGYGGARIEVDGQVRDMPLTTVTVRFVPAAVTVVAFDDQEPILTGLRRRQILTDSPRIMAEAERGLAGDYCEPAEAEARA
jgi:NAD+ kinase